MVTDGDELNLSRPVLVVGASLEEARAAVVLLHGRGATASGILRSLPDRAPTGFAYLAPQAPGYEWYPQPFTAPLEHNEPHLSSSLALVSEILAHLDGAGLTADKVILYGFSQGACLALEYAARNPQRYGGVVGLSGGLIGPEGLEREAKGSLRGSPVFLGCSDQDPHIERSRVELTAEVLAGMGAEVRLQFYPGLGHTINQDELDAVLKLMQEVDSATAES